MAGTMSLADLRADLKDSLHDAASVLGDPNDFDRCLMVAVEHLSFMLPRTLAATLTLAAEVAEYPAPADYLRFKMAMWGRATTVQPWDKAHPGRLPDCLYFEGALVLLPAPTAQQIGLLGNSYRYFYFAKYTLDELAANTTVPATLRAALLLRAQAECCKELAIRNVAKPVTMRDGGGGQPRNGTPGHLYNVLLAEFMARVSA